MTERPHVVIVVPVGPMHDRIARCLRSCRAQTYPHVTTVLVTDAPAPGDLFGARNLVTGSVTMTTPAAKRDAAVAAYPEAAIFAFLDDDAYAPPDWIARAVALFEAHPQAGAIGGPGLMPDDQTTLEALSAAVMETRLGSGALRYRFWSEPQRWCDDYPAYNLLVRASVLAEIGGWGSDLYGGEDTELCRKIVAAGHGILYDPSVAVRHYRRKIWPKHAWQMYNLGRSRATFFLRGDPSSRKTLYFAPSLGVLGLVALLLAFVADRRLRLPVAALAVAGYVVARASHPGKPSPAVRALLPVGLVVHHAAYGWGFALGLLTGRRSSGPTKASFLNSGSQ